MVIVVVIVVVVVMIAVEVVTVVLVQYLLYIQNAYIKTHQITILLYYYILLLFRYAIIKHCPIICCAPIEKVLQLLNDKHLGATVQEVAATDDDNHETDFEVYGVQAIFVSTIAMLFVLG